MADLVGSVEPASSGIAADLRLSAASLNKLRWVHDLPQTTMTLDGEKEPKAGGRIEPRPLSA